MNFEEAFDFTNWRNHPTRKKYLVFFFKTEAESNYFEALLIEHKIWFEKGDNDESQKARYLFAINRDDLGRVKNLNNLTIGKYRKPFMPNKVFKYIVMVISFIVLLLAVIGFVLVELG